MTDQISQPPELTSWLRMNQLVLGFMASQAIFVAAKLGIADLISEAPRTVDELAHTTKAHAPSLRRLLLMLASIGIFAEDSSGRFRHTPLSETLRTEDRQSIRNWAVLWGESWLWRPWGDLYHTVLTGEPAFHRIYGSSFFDYLAGHPDDAEIFDAGMSSGALTEILAAYDFSRFERMVDVGGGQGALLHKILHLNPKLRGVLADLPAVVAGATAALTGAVAERCEIAGIDFFKSVPEGADAYVMKAIVHDWDDVAAIKILKNCRRAIRNDGKLLLMEHILKPPNEPDPGLGRFIDLDMLVLLTGRERTEAEFETLLRAAGFSSTRVIPTTGYFSIIESEPA
jgi:SAM-dependent methyltransferase